MLKDAPQWAAVEKNVMEFIGDYNIVAYNAKFDKMFFDAELNW